MTAPLDPTLTTGPPAATDTRPPGTVDAPPAATDAPAPRSATDRYQALRLHATGGLGEVHLAEDAELHRPVALKRLQGHLADDPASRRRFLREAEITARLQHPGIVPVYGLSADAAGHPSYAMRFVEGEPLQEAIRRFHSSPQPRFEALEFRTLLQHFVAVCNAVAYAHSRGVVHRDLKPANIMVGRFGETLVVDWGVARTIDRTAAERADGEATVRATVDAAGDRTQLGSAVGTPAYMSPEQAAGRWDVLGPASDVYSLGAVLYTMLTARPSIANDTWPAMQQKIQRGDYPAPRQVNPAAPRALEAVCRKAMALEPADRYDSALTLAADIQHWLADEPVTADREPLTARLRRWGRRHRPLVAGAAALLLTAVVGLTVGVVLIGREQAATAKARDDKETARQDAVKQRDIALQQKRRTREALDAMTSDEALDWLTTQQELLPQQKAFLERALAYYQEFASETGEDAEGRALLAEAHHRVGWIFQTLVRLSEAEEQFRRAVDLWAELVAEQPGRPDYRVGLARCLNKLSNLLRSRGQAGAAEAPCKRAIELLEQLVAEQPAEVQHRDHLAQQLTNLGLLLANLGRRPEAEAAYRRAIELFGRQVADLPDVPRRRANLARSLTLLGKLLRVLGRNTEAEASYRQAIELFDRLAIDHPAIPLYRRNLAWSLDNLGFLLSQTGSNPEAESVFRRAVELQERLALDHPAVPDYRSELTDTLSNLGRLLRGQGRWDDAATIFRRSIVHLERLVRDYPDVPDYRDSLAGSFNNLGMMFNDQRKWPDAEAAWRRAVELRERLAKEHPAQPRYRDELAGVVSNVGLALSQQNRRPDAEVFYRRAIDLFGRLAEDYPDVPRYRGSLAIQLTNLSAAIGDSGDRRGEADAALRRSITINEQLADEQPGIVAYRSNLARNLRSLGRDLRNIAERRPEAETAFRRSVELYERVVKEQPDVPLHRERLAGCLNDLGDLLQQLGKSPDATPLYRRASELADRLVSDFPNNSTYASILGHSLAGVGLLLMRSGDLPEAEVALRKSVATHERLVAEPGGERHASRLGGDYCNLASVIRDRGDPAGALEWYAKAVARLEALAAGGTEAATVREFLRTTHGNRAEALNKLGRYTEAVRDWDRLAELTTGPLAGAVRERRADSLARAGDGARAAVEADAVARMPGVPAAALYRCAVILAIAATKDPANADRHAARAVALLRQSVVQGYTNVGSILTNPDLEVLRPRSDFADLLWDLADLPAPPPADRR